MITKRFFGGEAVFAKMLFLEILEKPYPNVPKRPGLKLYLN